MISCNITYYNEPHFLKWWYNTFKILYVEGYDIELNIADDGSMKHSAESFFDKNVPSPNMRLFRVLKDIGFNSHGARNLLMKQTRTKWNMLSDIDRKYSINTIKNIIVNESVLLKENTHYFFVDKNKQKSISDYIVSTEDFWNAGGYDEEFVNIHWGDRLFLKCLSYVSKSDLYLNWDVKPTRGARNVSYSADITTTQYPDDNTLICPLSDWTIKEKREALIKTVDERNKTHEGRMSKKVINFEWEQVF